MGGIISLDAVRVSRSLELADTALPVVLHHQGFVIWESRGLVRLLRTHNVVSRGRSVLRFVAPEYAQQAEDVVRRAPVCSRFQVSLVRADGVRIPVEVRGEAVVVQGVEMRRVEVRVMKI